MGEEGDLARTRLARGCRCFGAWLGEELIAYGWLSTGAEWIGELGLEIKPAAGEAYCWNCVTLPRHRRRGVFQALLGFIHGQATSDGLVRLWIGSVADLGGKAIAGAGFAPVLRLTVSPLPWVRRLAVRSADGAEPGSVAAARQALGTGGRPLRLGSSFRPAKSRTH